MHLCKFVVNKIYFTLLYVCMCVCMCVHVCVCVCVYVCVCVCECVFIYKAMMALVNIMKYEWHCP